MKRFWNGIKEKFKRWPMQKKMFFSYTVPTILIIVASNILAFPIISNSYQQELKNTILQTNDQAQNFMMNYAENMDYISQLITQNWEIKDTLSSSGFGVYQNDSESYREFYKLNSEFRSIELSNRVYRIGIYMPDRFLYTNNNYYFYPESDLKTRSDYAELMRTVWENRYYFATAKEKTASNPEETDSYLALFQPLRITNPQGVEYLYVVKVEIPLEHLTQVLSNAADTVNGQTTYLTSASGKLICATDGGVYTRLRQIGSLPSWNVKDWEKVTVGEKSYFVFSRQVQHYKWQIVSLIPQNEFFRRTGFIWLLAAVLLICLASAVAFISYFLSRYYAGRLSKINQKMKSLESGDMSDRFVLKKDSGDEVDEIYANFNYMAERLHRLMKEHFRLGKEVASANLKALQAQINPHFLYNTLDLINWGAMDYGAVQVAEIARNLGQFYRLSLNHGKTAIRIEDELRHVEAYVSIENAHFSGAISLDTNVPDDIRHLACPNIILQPFVENAIVHGIAKHPEIVECNISITARRQENDILFALHDDGPGMDEKQTEAILKEDFSGAYNGYGVRNINLRLRLCYGKEYGVFYKSARSGGTTAYIRIPAIGLDDLNALLK